MSTEFIDEYNDTLRLYGGVDDDSENVYVDAKEGSDYTELSFSKDQAKNIADELYRLAGVVAEAPVMASNISFNEGVVRLAAIHGKTVKFRYVKSSKHSPEDRQFVPTSVQGAGDNLRFLGRDPDRDNEFRSYRLDRIKGTVGIVGDAE